MAVILCSWNVLDSGDVMEKKKIFEYQDEEMNAVDGTEFAENSVSDLSAEMLAESYFVEEDFESFEADQVNDFAIESLPDNISPAEYFTDNEKKEATLEKVPMVFNDLAKSTEKQAGIVKEYLEESAKEEVKQTEAIVDETSELVEKAKSQSWEIDYQQIAGRVYEMILNRLLSELNGSGTIT